MGDTSPERKAFDAITVFEAELGRVAGQLAEAERFAALDPRLVAELAEVTNRATEVLTDYRRRTDARDAR